MASRKQSKKMDVQKAGLKKLGSARRRKGALGRMLRVKDHCYARPVLGRGCSAEFSEEHPLSQVLRRGKELEIHVTTFPGGGAAPRKTLVRKLPIKQMSGRILCVTHNGALSDADNEAARLNEALRESRDRLNSKLARPFQRYAVDGQRFGRFLCKYVAGWMALFGKTVDGDFIRYAFGQLTTRRIYFLFPVRVGGKATLGDTSNLPIRTYLTDPGAPEAYHVKFEGLDVVVSNAPADDPSLAEMRAAFEGCGFMDRTTTFEMPEMRITFNWDADPDHARILDALGRPTPRR